MTDQMAAAAPDPKAHAFTFGDPEPVLSGRDFLEHIECWRNGKWYEPPVNPYGLAKAFRATPHHESALRVKVNLLTSTFVPHKLLSRQQFQAWALDHLVLGNGYLERRDNIGGRPLRLERAIGKFMRRGVDDLEQYFLLHQGPYGGLGSEHEFKPRSVFHLREPDLNQEIYGVPEYLGALQSTFLNEAATIFRRRYYVNGSHAGFILYMTDAAQSEDDITALRTALKDSKGPGNFRNLFMYAPGGKEKGIQLIPVSEVAAKDEFLNIKGVTRDDQLAAHRVPPQLLGIVPANAGGFGDVAKAAEVFHYIEIVPLQSRFEQLNDWIGEEVISWRPYEGMPSTGAANDAGGRRGSA